MHSPPASITGKPAPPTLSETFPGDSEMAALMRAFDWATTPFGPVERWPQSLRTVVQILLTSRFAMWMGWGPELTFVYNDAYRHMTLGAKHPQALGRPASEVWKEIWKDIGPRIQAVLETGTATWDERLLLFLERSGYAEETYHTFSYSPLADGGVIAGMLCVVTEETQRVIGERRLRVLREVAEKMGEIRTPDEVFAAVEGCLAANAHDLPFTLTYLLDADGSVARLASCTGIDAAHPAAVATIAVAPHTGDAVWPVYDVIETLSPVLVAATAPRLSNLPTGPWDRPPNQVLVMPIARQGQTRPAGVFVAGLNPYRPLDDEYRGYLDLFVGQIAAGLSNAHAYELERRRAEALAELDRAKTTFFSNISHEFRTPLTLMLGPVEDALADEEEPLPPGQRERQEIVRRNAVRLLKLVNALLDFSRIEAGRVQTSYEPTDLSVLTADLASMFRSAVERAGLRLIVDTPPLGEPVYVDREMWEKIVLNLLSNAFKFTLEGEIEVSLHRTGDYVQLRVRDTGSGIPEAELPHLFERFRRVEGMRGRTIEGSGIGLALVQELARLHGGEVTVASTEGKGSTFTVSIPAGRAHLPDERIGTPHEPAAASPGVTVYVEEALRWLPDEDDPARHGPEEAADRGDRPRILLADDNADMRDYVRRLLRDRFEVEAVPNGTAALEAARRQVPDLVLSDVMMPDMSGFHVLHALRQDPRTRNVPVILLSARAGEEARIEGLEAGADDYLTKPFSARELLARVNAHLELQRMRREVAAAVEAERRRLFELFEQVPVAICVFRGPDHVYELVNMAYQRLMSGRHLIGCPMAEAVPELVEQGFGRLLDEVYTTGEPRAGRAAPLFYDWRGNGVPEQVFFNFVYQPLRQADGTVVGVFVVASDVSDEVRAREQAEQLAAELEAERDHLTAEVAERRRAEMQLKELNETLEARVAARTEALERANTLLEQRNRELQEFTYVASHDLQEPLRKVSTFADLLRHDYGEALDATALSYMTRMQDAAQRMSQLIHDLLAFSRVTTQGKPFEQIDLNGILTDVVSDLEVSLKETGGTVQVAPLPEIHADPTQMRQLFQNLLSNALKFHRPGVPPVVRVRASVVPQAGAPGFVRFTIEDNGIGFEEKYADRIFGPFQRLHGRSTYPGTGIGLTVCRRIVERHHGTITAKSTPGRGSTFVLTLPLRHPSPAAEPEPNI